MNKIYKDIVKKFYKKTPYICYYNLHNYSIYKNNCNCIDICKYTPPSQNLKSYNILEYIITNNKKEEKIFL